MQGSSYVPPSSRDRLLLLSQSSTLQAQVKHETSTSLKRYTAELERLTSRLISMEQYGSDCLERVRLQLDELEQSLEQTRQQRAEIQDDWTEMSGNLEDSIRNAMDDSMAVCSFFYSVRFFPIASGS